MLGFVRISVLFWWNFVILFMLLFMESGARVALVSGDFSLTLAY